MNDGLREALDALLMEWEGRAAGEPDVVVAVYGVCASGVRAALATAPPEPRWPSRDELAKALWDAPGSTLPGEYAAFVDWADAILAALREGGQRP